MKKLNLQKWIPVLAMAALMVVLSACSNKADVSACVTGVKYGFWSGLWHGIIAPIDLIAMLFRSDVTVFAQNNNGAWYAFGFMIGSGGWGFLGGARAGKKK